MNSRNKVLFTFLLSGLLLTLTFQNCADMKSSNSSTEAFNPGSGQTSVQAGSLQGLCDQLWQGELSGIQVGLVRVYQTGIHNTLFENTEVDALNNLQFAYETEVVEKTPDYYIERTRNIGGESEVTILKSERMDECLRGLRIAERINNVKLRSVEDLAAIGLKNWDIELSLEDGVEITTGAGTFMTDYFRADYGATSPNVVESYIRNYTGTEGIVKDELVRMEVVTVLNVDGEITTSTVVTELSEIYQRTAM